jgi:hypothetical protein
MWNRSWPTSRHLHSIYSTYPITTPDWNILRFYSAFLSYIRVRTSPALHLTTETGPVSETLCQIYHIEWSWEYSVGIAARVRFPTGVREFSLLYSVQTGSGNDPSSYRMVIGGFSRGKAAGDVKLSTHLHSPICLHGIVLKWLSTGPLRLPYPQSG